jgi:stearoyl-CoA desaturase (delta-9 desaturase)
VIALAGYHMVGLLAFVPWLFSWTGVILAAAGFFVFGILGVNVCYHRLLTHRGFKCSKWFEYSLTILGVCALQGSPAYWVAVHRRHHQHSDERPDPHSPLVNFLWAHVGWLLVEKGDLTQLTWTLRYAKDLRRQPFYRNLERSYVWVVLGSWVIFFAGGFIGDLLSGSTALKAMQFASSVLLWGVVVRTIAVWHITWSVNSITHLWGYRNYETDENSRNNVLVGILAGGEGWHNNHHADQRAAKHGHRWWEIDLSYWIIRLFAALGLARGVVMPDPALLRRLKDDRPVRA